MSRPRTHYTRTVLFAETFDFPTPPRWDRQSILEARRSISASHSPSPCSLEPVDSWQAVRDSAASECTRPRTPVRSRLALPSPPTSPFHPEDKLLPACPMTSGRPEMIQEETQDLAVVPWSGPHYQTEDLQDRPQQQHSQQLVQDSQQWPWNHPHAPSPDCPCCSSHFTSRWSICSDDSRPPSPSSSIHQRLRKMASSNTLRSVRSSIRLRVKTSILQLTRRGH